MGNKLYVVGIGYKPLDKRARDIILNSSIILASKRLFEVFKGYDEFEGVKDRVKVINNVDETIEFIKTNFLQPSALSLPIVLLASGDPMFFGIGRRAVREFGKENVEIIPDLSSIQLAFSRIKEPWDDAFLMSLHGESNHEKGKLYTIKDIPSLITRHSKIAILTDRRRNDPSAIAKQLLQVSRSPFFTFTMFVFERLGYPDERIIEGKPEDIESMSFSYPNLVIIKKLET